MYHYAGNNPVRYTDPDGRYDTATAQQLSQSFGPWAGCAFFCIMTVGLFCSPEIRQDLADGFQDIADCIVYVCDTIKTEVNENYEFSLLVKARVKELTKDKTKDKSTGSYVIIFESNKTYCGKGGQKRAAKSAVREGCTNTDLPVSIEWEPALNDREAFKDEYVKIQDHNGPQNNPMGDHSNYNRIQSPGMIFYLIDNGTLYIPQNNDK